MNSLNFDIQFPNQIITTYVQSLTKTAPVCNRMNVSESI